MKWLIFIGCLIVIISIIYFNYGKVTQYLSLNNDDSKNNFDTYIGSSYKGNFVWGGAMNLAWNEFNENILHEKIQLDTNNKVALEISESLNRSSFSKKDLDEESYYIKSGYGQKIIDQINTELNEKFPLKTFNDLDNNLSPRSIISYVYFFKDVEYKNMFNQENVLFNNTIVDGFVAYNSEQKENIKIIRYENDDKFIIKLLLKDENDELILAKGYDMNNPKGVVDEIKHYNQKKLINLAESDNFKSPKLFLDYHHDYIDLIGKRLLNEGFKDYYISKMYENFKFNMDQKGAKIENEAVMTTTLTAQLPNEIPKVKNFILDKPYWVIMKRVQSQKPYFILGVNNIELMNTKDNLLYSDSTFSVELKKEVQMGNLFIKLDQIIYEEIAQSPDDVAAYPGGSGKIVNLSLKADSKEEKITFTQLSPPYESQLHTIWEDYSITLKEVNDTSILIDVQYLK